MSSEREIVSFILSGSKMRDQGKVGAWFETLRTITENSDLEVEFIVVVPYSDVRFQEELITNSMGYPVQVVVVGERNSWDQKIFAGLSRANGDYSLIIGETLEGVEVVLPQMIELARAKECDVVGLRNRISLVEKLRNARTETLYGVLRRITKTPLSIRNCTDLLITRKALNWILRDLSSAQCMVEMYLIPGLTAEFIETETVRTRYKLSGNMYSRLLTRYTLIPLAILKSCFSITILVTLGISLNALSVRWRGVNLLNHVEEQIPGWTTLVLLISFGFAVTIYALYILLRTILHLAQEYSTKPNYIIKSVQRP